MNVEEFLDGLSEDEKEALGRTLMNMYSDERKIANDVLNSHLINLHSALSSLEVPFALITKWTLDHFLAYIIGCALTDGVTKKDAIRFIEGSLNKVIDHPDIIKFKEKINKKAKKNGSKSTNA